MDSVTPETLRFSCFAAVFATMALWEIVAPRREPGIPRSSRWPANLAILALGALFSRLALSVLPLEMALIAQEKGLGLFNSFKVEPQAAFALSLLALDLTVWVQHVLFHAVPLLWRLHMVHHADPHVDFTTGVRFHPVEILISAGIKVAAVALLGPPVVAVLVFEIALNACAMFNHGNVRLMPGPDAFLRLFIVTPDMHRVHHSVLAREMNTNFGFGLSLWDRFFGTYRAQPTEGHERMTIGLSRFQGERRQSLWWLLALPFKVGPDLPVRPVGK